MNNQLIVSDLVKLQRTIKINGVDFEEDFLARLIREHLALLQMLSISTLKKIHHLQIGNLSHTPLAISIHLRIYMAI
jgi:hypothetical protein